MQYVTNADLSMHLVFYLQICFIKIFDFFP